MVIESSAGRADRFAWPQRSRFRVLFQTISPPYTGRKSTARPLLAAHAFGRPCCARGAGTRSAFSVFVIRVSPSLGGQPEDAPHHHGLGIVDAPNDVRSGSVCRRDL